MERNAYPVDEKLFYLLVEEKFSELNTDELQGLFDNSFHEISDQWVFISDKAEGEYQKEFENHRIELFFRHHGLYGYKYFSLIDYEDNSTYKIGIPDVSSSDGGIDRQKCVIIELRDTEPDYIIDLKRYIFNKLASGMQIDNYLINNMKRILIHSFTEFFNDEFGKIQDRVAQNNSPTEHKNPFFVTYNVDLEQFQEHKNVVAEKLHILKDIIGMNIKEVFFKPYTNKNIIRLINMQRKIMDLIRAINEYIRADASLYLKWENPWSSDKLSYDKFDSQMLSKYKEEEPDEENIKNIERIVLNKLGDFLDDWYDSESLILSSKNSFYFRSRQLINKVYRFVRGFVSFISNNILRRSFGKSRKCYHRIRSYIREHEWVRILIGYVVLSILSGFGQAVFQKWIVVG